MKSIKTNLPSIIDCSISIIGLGYVGLPLAVEFAKQKRCLLSGKTLNRKVIGFDINKKRINELEEGFDKTNEIDNIDLINRKDLIFTTNPKMLEDVDVYIITVPTPIDRFKRPDFSFLKDASKRIGQVIKKRTKETFPLIIYESTVYPGATEEVCIPIIEEESMLNLNQGFYVGYSPERINPGDKKHSLTSIVKVTSGSNIESTDWIDQLYGSIIKSGTHKASSIKIAEAAKVIENTQRDLNIALVNELAIIFNKLNINTQEVLKAAGTKWNFIDFKPGLVGGHCIGIDPYYLTYKCECVGYTPKVVLAGREINDNLSKWVVDQLILNMARKEIPLGGTEVLILGFSFKENCNDIRNTKVIDIINHLKEYGINPVLVDPLVDSEEIENEYNIKINSEINFDISYHAIIIAVAHDCFKSINSNQWMNLIKDKGVFIDIKGILPKDIKTITL